VQTVVIVDYDPAWPKVFESLSERIRAALGPTVIAIEHVGSTSIPDMPAKPIIDMDVVVKPEDVQHAIAAIEALGYRHEGNLGVDGREAFRWCADFPEHHLYLCPENSHALRRHVLFRDYLRQNPDAAREYGKHKREMAALHHSDRSKYQDAKAGFIETLFQRAEEAARRNGNA
jgi:GrpB-like predicted nucleotidyltransferase (UPF0157 family)